MNPLEHPPRPRGLPLLRLRVWLAEFLRPTELQVTLFWAGIIGVLGALASVGFRYLATVIHTSLTGYSGGYVESFKHMEPWHRLFVPTLGGLAAGLTLFFGMRLSRAKSSTDYMEAIALGDGVVSSRSSLVKCASALCSISSGASIGREGPLVQLAAMLASLIGRRRKVSTVQLRLLVACGAAAGIASAYNAPITGALFVAEIILGSLAMETFGPLVFASVISTLTVHSFLGADPLYQISMPVTRLSSNWQILPAALLGLVAGLAAPWFLRFLRLCERSFSKVPIPSYVRLALGGVIVGALAIAAPQVVGNGYSVINELLHREWIWRGVVFVLALKLLATGATFGSGAVGGVFTPTLFVGACLGSLWGDAVRMVWPSETLPSGVFVLIGMGAFLAGTTQAPLMAILMVFELTLDYQIILPLMLACVLSHYTARAFEGESIYAESLRRKRQGGVQQRLGKLRVADIMRHEPPTVLETASFAEIAQKFLLQRFNYLYVVDAENRFHGAISLHDIKAHLNEPDLAALVIASDLVISDFSTVTPDESLMDALNRFAHHDGERLAVIDTVASRHLLGSIAKTDLLLALAEHKEPTELSAQQVGAAG